MKTIKLNEPQLLDCPRCLNRFSGEEVEPSSLEMPYSVGDRVISSSKYSFGKSGVVWKITDKAVHVRFDDDFFQKFHFASEHHLQTKLEFLRHFI